MHSLVELKIIKKCTIPLLRSRDISWKNRELGNFGCVTMSVPFSASFQVCKVTNKPCEGYWVYIHFPAYSKKEAQQREVVWRYDEWLISTVWHMQCVVNIGLYLNSGIKTYFWSFTMLLRTTSEIRVLRSNTVYFSTIILPSDAWG